MARLGGNFGCFGGSVFEVFGHIVSFFLLVLLEHGLSCSSVRRSRRKRVCCSRLMFRKVALVIKRASHVEPRFVNLISTRVILSALSFVRFHGCREIDIRCLSAGRKVERRSKVGS